MPRIRPFLRTKKSVVDLADLRPEQAELLSSELSDYSQNGFHAARQLTSRELGESIQAYNEVVDVAAAGTYTPTVSLTAFASSSSAYTLSYYRIGDNVMLFGRVDVTPSSSGAWTEFKMTLPPVSSNFTDANDVGGSGTSWSHANTPVAFRADVSGDLIHGKFYSVDTSAHEFQCTIGYKVL